MINPKVTWGVWCALLLCVSGQDAVPNAGDRLEVETAARLREFEKNNNRGGPRRPMSPEMDEVSNHPDLLDNLRAENLAKMSLDDPLLKWAYACVFLRSMGPFEQLEPPLELVLADMRRRGEAVSPMLLKLVSENQENNIEFSILGKIEHLDTVGLEPFLEYARKLLRERTQTMTGYAAAAASYMLARHGTRDDEALLEWVVKERPYVAPDLIKDLKIMRARLDPPQSGSRPERRDIPSSNAEKGVGPAENIKDHPQDGGSAISQTTPWIISGIILVVLVGVYRFLRQRLRGQSS